MEHIECRVRAAGHVLRHGAETQDNAVPCPAHGARGLNVRSCQERDPSHFLRAGCVHELTHRLSLVHRRHQGDTGQHGVAAAAIAAAPNLARIVYFSTIGVYGEHGGRWVDESSATLTRSERGLARLADEARWTEAARGRGIAADILRLPGIYGPGRNALDKLRRGEARRIVKPNHVVNRAHVDDIAEVARLVLVRGLEGRIWNVADDEPAPPEDVVAYAAGLLGLPPPPEEPLETAALSPFAASFYAEEKRVSNAKAKALLGFAPAYPTYREGLRALYEAGEGRSG